MSFQRTTSFSTTPRPDGAADGESVRVIGLLGLLVHAKDRGMIAALKPLLDELKTTGFYFGDSLYHELLRRVGEA